MSVVGVDKTNTLARSMGLSVCQVEVVFDSPADKLLSIGFSDILTNSPIGFYQNSYGDDLPPNSAFCTMFPALCLDSFVTIGVGTEGTGGDNSVVDADWNSSLFNTGGATAGGWFNTNPDNSQGVPNASLHVLIAQLTIRRGYGIEGDLTVYYNDGTMGFPATFQCYGGVPGDGPSGPMSEPQEGESGAPVGGSGCCGDPFATDCFDPAGSIGPCCNCAPCCELVCAADPFCCEMAWDGLCTTAALENCDPALCDGGFDGPAGPAGEGGSGAPAGDQGCPTSVRYVDDNGSPGNNCSSWAFACPDLQTALSLSSNGGQIWVAQGTYRPTPSNDRTASFHLINCVAVYGGFPNGGSAFADRNPDLYPTILSGDIGQPGVDTDNSFHVVSAGSVATAVDDTAILDGFTVTQGHADGQFSGVNGPDQGSAVNIWHDSTPTLHACRFTDNTSYNHGAVNDHGGAFISNCIFENNEQTGQPAPPPPPLQPPALGGAGLYIHGNTASVVTNCDFLNNNCVAYGGGVYINMSSDPTPTSQAAFSHCTFSGNVASKGGGMYIAEGSSPLIEDCAFTGNHVNASPFWGAAMNIESLCEPEIRNSQFVNNTSLGYGGVYTFGTKTVFVNCEFRDNSSRNGSAIYMTGANARVDAINCVFKNNLADTTSGPTFSSGGAIIADAGTSNGAVNLDNCLFVGNRATRGQIANGGAIHIDGSTVLSASNCTFVGNQADDVGGGLYLETGTIHTLDNCIFWDNTDSTGSGESAQVHVLPGATATVTYSDIMDDDPESVPFGGASNGNIDLDPQFANAGTGDYRLSSGSPCIDAADNDLAEACSLDLDGNERYVEDLGALNCPYLPNTCGTPPIADMGAYERLSQELVDCNVDGLDDTCCPDLAGGNGIVNAADLAMVLGAWGNPGCGGEAPCCPDLNGDGQVNASDLALVIGNWGPC